MLPFMAGGAGGLSLSSTMSTSTGAAAQTGASFKTGADSGQQTIIVVAALAVLAIVLIKK